MATHVSKSFTQAAGYRPAAQQPAPVLEPGADARTPSIGADERRRMIQERAYTLYERRGFVHGHELDDWFAAEAQVDRILSRQRKSESIEASEMPEPDLHQSGGRSIIRNERMKRILKQHPQRDVPKV